MPKCWRSCSDGRRENRLPVRIFCIGGAAAGSPEQVEKSHAADRTHEVVPGRHLHRRCGVRGERVHAAARPDVCGRLRSHARSARAVAPPGDGDRQSAAAAPRARGAARHDRCVPRSDRGGEQGVSDQEPALGARPREPDQRVAARAHEEARHVRRRAPLGRHQRRDHARGIWRRRRRHAAARDDSEERHHVGARQRRNRRESVPADDGACTSR